MSLFALIADQPMTICVMVFPTKEEGELFVDKAFADFPHPVHKNTLDNGSIQWKFYSPEFFKDRKSGEKLYDKFFTYYYDGNGSCFAFTLQEIEYGTKFVRYDTD